MTLALTQQVAQLRIARQIVEAEEALNHALITHSTLFTSLVSARSETEVGKFTGQDALMRLLKGHQSLLTAGNDLARVHVRLLEIAQETGQTAEGCPDNWRQIGQTDETVAA